MTRHTRRIFFYIGLAIFLLIAPLLISYSLGYTLNLSKGIVEKTGGIFIKSKTPRLSIFLNGQFIKETSYLSGGALLTEITPGNHRLRLEKTGYHPWSKTIPVELSVVTDLRNIILIPNPPTLATTTSDELANLRIYATQGSFQSVMPKETMSTPALSSLPSSPLFFLDGKGNLVGKTATTSTIFVSRVNSFGVVDDMIYFIDKNGFLGRINPLSNEITTIGRPGFYLVEQPAQFSSSPDGGVIILDASGGLFLSDGITTIQTITGGVREFSLDNTGQKLLIRKDQSIDILWLRDNAYQPFEKRGMRQEIFSSNSLIQDSAWYFDDNAHVVIRLFEGIFFTDIDARDGKNIFTLFTKKTDELVTVPQIPASIFFRREKIFYTISL
ncbi:MAG: PEGA domain-containing protein [Candidatus Sungbacteria bacterium]|nr:PEGA domain-containing protein [bacterium]MDZ4260102.1 PEGA domain-containing protein [Candidatus Sungbacteria bacterium]